MMSKYQLLLWLAFENTGNINDYLKYKLLERLTLEAGEDFGFDKNFRYSAEQNKIR